MKILLDTHVWLWALAEPERLKPRIRSLLTNPEHELFFSIVSSWEIAIKYARGTLPLPEPPAAFIPPRLQRDNYKLLRIEHVHVLAVATLPMYHRDPFDRLLIAQAQREKLTVLTADRQFKAYKVRTLLAA